MPNFNIEKYFSEVEGDYQLYWEELMKGLTTILDSSLLVEDDSEEISQDEKLLRKRELSRRELSERLYTMIENACKLLPENTDVIIACLKATKTYINSRDCGLRGRYQTTSYFRGGIIFTYSTKEFRCFNDALDCYIEAKENMRLLHNEEKENAPSRQYAATSHKRITKDYSISWASIFILLLSLRGVLAAKSTTNPKHQDNNLVCRNDFLSTHSKFLCSQHLLSDNNLQQLNADYHVFSNVPLECAEFVLIPEIHDQHSALQEKHIPKLMNADDVILIEGLPSLEETRCVRPTRFQHQPFVLHKKAPCIGWDHPVYASADVGRGKLEKYTRRLLKHFLAQSIDEIEFIVTRFYRLPKEVGVFNEVEFYALRNIINAAKKHHVNSIPHKITEDFQKDFTGVFIQRFQMLFMNYDIEGGIYDLYCRAFGKHNLKKFKTVLKKMVNDLVSHDGERNAEMLHTAQTLKTPRGEGFSRKLFIGGAAHFFKPLPSMKDLQITVENGKITERRSGDNHQEEELIEHIADEPSEPNAAKFREYMEEESYAMLYPK